MKKILTFLFSRPPADANASEPGFALIEAVVALVIMALVGLMAWRGMDAMILGREVIDKRATQDADYSQLIRQFECDCQSLLSKDEIASSTIGGIINSAVASGAKNIWFLRRYRADNLDAWLIAGYGAGSEGLQRWTSRLLMQRTESVALWAGITRDPDLISSDLLVSLDLPSIVRQSFQVQTSVLSGAGGWGISAGGTGGPTNAAANSSSGTSTSVPAFNSGVGANPSVGINPIVADQQGVMMQWWIKGIALPITRSCLMGGAL